MDQAGSKLGLFLLQPPTFAKKKLDGNTKQEVSRLWSCPLVSWLYLNPAFCTVISSALLIGKQLTELPVTVFETWNWRDLLSILSMCSRLLCHLCILSLASLPYFPDFSNHFHMSGSISSPIFPVSCSQQHRFPASVSDSKLKSLFLPNLLDFFSFLFPHYWDFINQRLGLETSSHCTTPGFLLQQCPLLFPWPLSFTRLLSLSIIWHT